MRPLLPLLLIIFVCSGAAGALAFEDTAKTQIKFCRTQHQPLRGYVATAFITSGQTAFVQPEPIIANHDIEAAVVVTGGPLTKGAVIQLKLSQEASKKFAAFTKQHINQPLAILVNGRIVSMPVIRTKITSGVVVISGKFTREEADKIIHDLK